MSTCPRLLKTGPRKGQPCGKSATYPPSLPNGLIYPFLHHDNCNIKFSQSKVHEYFSKYRNHNYTIFKNDIISWISIHEK